MHEWPCVAIAGPTATGKTALAVALAHALRSEIFSMDSRQVYRGLDLGTGKDLEEYRRFNPPVPYHLIDSVDPSEVYGLYRFQGDCYAALEEFRSRRGSQVPPVLAGGTGLYLESILRRFDIPEVPEDLELRTTLMRREFEVLKVELRQRSHDIYSRTDLTSKKRVVRALEVAIHRPADFIPLSRHPEWVLQPLIFITRWERERLRLQIEKRLQARLEAGLVQEVRTLLAAGISWERLNLLGMEYREVAAFLRGEKSEKKMQEDLLHEIHLLAKRQETYFRGLERRGLKTVFIGPEITADELLERYAAWRHGGFTSA